MKEIAIANRIKKLIQSTGITQTELANRSGMDISRISRIINCHANPTIKTIERMEAILQADIITVK